MAEGTVSRGRLAVRRFDCLLARYIQACGVRHVFERLFGGEPGRLALDHLQTDDL